MTDLYQVASGFDNVAGLATLVVQPACPPFQDGRLSVAGDGLSYEDGVRTTEFIYGYLTYVNYALLLAACGGLSDSIYSAEVTVRLKRSSDRTFRNYNAIITRPIPRNDGGKFLDVRFPLQVFPTPL